MIPQSYVMVVQALLGGDCKLTTILEEEGNIMLDPTPLSNPTAAAAKSLQSCPTLCDPVDGSPPGSPDPRILQARTLKWGAISFFNAWKRKVKVKSPH